LTRDKGIIATIPQSAPGRLLRIIDY